MGNGLLTSVVFFLAAFLSAQGGPVLLQDEETKYLEEEIQASLVSGRATPGLRSVVEEMDLAGLVGNALPWEWRTTSPVKRDPKFNLLCTTCALTIGGFIQEVENGKPPEVVAASVIELCVNLGISNRKLCQNFIDRAEPQLYWVLTNKHVTGKDFCGTMFVGFGCDSNNPDRVWEVTLPNTPKPPLLPTKPVSEDKPTMKVLHLADTHFDPYYSPGSNANCPEKYFCCRNDSGPLETPDAAAGKWGDYRNCDAPKWLLEALFQHVTQTHPDIDFILWTGDLVPHIIWDTSRKGNLKIIRETMQMILGFFPDVPIFPAIGNHESHPVNSYPQPYIDNEFDVSWLYDELAVLWQTWLPEDVASTVSYSAYYTTLIRPGLRVISVNTNYCYGFNWWLIYDSSDIADELSWMASELQKAEDKGEFAYVISHIPPGHSDCSKTWSHEYNRIINRYESTIAGLFYGHTHKDHFEIFYDLEATSRPYHVGYVAQSQTPYHNLNPGYKIYTIEGDFEGSRYRVLDHENWIMDLKEANAKDDPKFFKLYSAKDAYGMEDLSPKSWHSVVEQMSEPNSTLFDDFYKYYSKAAWPYQEEGCNDKCRQSLLCGLVTSDNSDHSHCKALSDRYF